MEAQKAEVFALFMAAMQLHERKDPSTCSAYLNVMGAALQTCIKAQAAGVPLSSPAVTQLLTLVENAASAARKTAGLTSASPSETAPGVEVTSPSGLATPEAATAAGEAEPRRRSDTSSSESHTPPPPLATATASSPPLNAHAVSASTPTAGTPRGTPQGGLSPLGTASATAGPFDQPPTPTSPAAAHTPPAGQGMATSNTASTGHVPLSTVAGAAVAAGVGGAGLPSSTAATATTTTAVTAPKDYITEAKRINYALRLQFERQRKTHHNPDMLRMSMLREMTANMEHAKQQQAAADLRAAEAEAEAAATHLRAAGEREIELRAVLKKTPHDTGAQAELAACVMERAVAAMIAAIDGGETVPSDEGFCCVNQLVQHKMHALLEAVDEKYPELENSPAPHAVVVAAVATSGLAAQIAAGCDKCGSLDHDLWVAGCAAARSPADFGIKAAHLDGTDFGPAVGLVRRLDIETELGAVLKLFVSTSQSISATVSTAGKGEVGAEDLLPLLAYVLHTARPARLPGQLRVCECLMSFSQANGMEGYAVRSTSIAANLVAQLAAEAGHDAEGGDGGAGTPP